MKVSKKFVPFQQARVRIPDQACDVINDLIKLSESDKKCDSNYDSGT